ncbi:hypothetical protein ACFY97_18755 [Streptomyces klenkii]|uniref:hypothetical protein n=1 Tax=Streptomyces klenkii TaxID=1420899 RepID=UPI0036E91B86
MSLTWQISLGRARVALLVAGLAWIAGIQPPWYVRIGLLGLVLAALVLDGAITDRTLADAVVNAKPPPNNDYRPAA